VLTAAALAFVAVTAGAAAAELPVTGAFGLEFAEPVPEGRLGASVGAPPYPLPPGNLDQTPPADVAAALDGWYLFTPDARPELLSSPDVRFYVLRSHTGLPVRVLAEHPQPDCIDDVLWLTRSLAKKYAAADDPFGAERAGFRQGARFVSPAGQIDIYCGPRLLIEYTNPAGYRTWLAQRAARAAEREAAAANLAEEHAALRRARQREFAELLTAGDPLRLRGAFGIPFGEPVAAEWLATDEVIADQPLAAQPPELPEPLADGRFTLTVGPELEPIRVAGEFADADASRFEYMAGALEEKFGPPLKKSPRHRIHKVSGDYLVARYLADESVARLVFIDDEGREAQKAREAAAKAERLAEQRRQFEEETAGL